MSPFVVALSALLAVAQGPEKAPFWALVRTENVGNAWLLRKRAGNNAWDTLGWVPGTLSTQEWILSGASTNDSLAIHFVDPIAWAQQRKQGVNQSYPVDNDPSQSSPWIRRAPMDFGWDIARPSLAVHPEGLTAERLSAGHLLFPKVTLTGTQQDSVVLEGQWLSTTEESVRLSWSWNHLVMSQEVRVQEGDTVPLRLALSVASAGWWEPRPAGGRPPSLPVVHSAFFFASAPGGESFRQRWSWARRSVGWDTTNGQSPLYVKINEKPVYAAGVNAIYTPQQEPMLRQRLTEMYRAGGNTVRFWGGGYYPSSSLLRLTDSLGLMVWIDLAFSGSTYPAAGPVYEEMLAEVDFHARRCGHHPSVVLFCGNNEIDIAWKHWGWQEKYAMSPEDSAKQWQDHVQLFYRDFPALLHKGAPTIPYIHTSPVSNWGKPSDFKKGDNHDWRVWHGEQPTAVFQERTAPFVSEWGVPALPTGAHTRWNFAELDSKMLSYKGLRLLKHYLEQEMGVHPEQQNTVFSLERASQKWQAKVISKTIASHAAAAPFCMGSLVWQLNDVDDVISWSLIGVDNRPKKAWRSALKAWRRIHPTLPAPPYPPL